MIYFLSLTHTHTRKQTVYSSSTSQYVSMYITDESHSIVFTSNDFDQRVHIVKDNGEKHQYIVPYEVQTTGEENKQNEFSKVACNTDDDLDLEIVSLIGESAVDVDDVLS